MPAAKWAMTDGERMLVGSASRIASASCSAASANLPSSARLMTSQERSQTDGGAAIPKCSETQSAGNAARLSVASSTARSYSPRK